MVRDNSVQAPHFTNDETQKCWNILPKDTQLICDRTVSRVLILNPSSIPSSSQWTRYFEMKEEERCTEVRLFIIENKMFILDTIPVHKPMKISY